MNTDDPHMFGTNLTEEYRRVASTFSLGAHDTASLICNAIRGSFMPDPLRATMLSDVAAALVEATTVANDLGPEASSPSGGAAR